MYLSWIWWPLYCVLARPVSPCAQYDCDARLMVLWLLVQTLTIPYLVENPEVGYVQARWIFANPDESYLTKVSFLLSFHAPPLSCCRSFKSRFMSIANRVDNSTYQIRRKGHSPMGLHVGADCISCHRLISYSDSCWQALCGTASLERSSTLQSAKATTRNSHTRSHQEHLEYLWTPSPAFLSAQYLADK